MRIDILCLFPETFASPLNQSIIKRAREQGLVDIAIHDIRDYTHDRHHTADDYSYGGGPGMVLKPDVLAAAIAKLSQVHLIEPAYSRALLSDQTRVRMGLASSGSITTNR